MGAPAASVDDAAEMPTECEETRMGECIEQQRVSSEETIIGSGDGSRGEYANDARYIICGRSDYH